MKGKTKIVHVQQLHFFICTAISNNISILQTNCCFSSIMTHDITIFVYIFYLVYFFFTFIYLPTIAGKRHVLCCTLGALLAFWLRYFTIILICILIFRKLQFSRGTRRDITSCEKIKRGFYMRIAISPIVLLECSTSLRRLHRHLKWEDVWWRFRVGCACGRR